MSQPTTTGPSGPKGPAGRSAGAQARAARAAAARAERERKARAAKMRNLAISIAVVVVLAIAAVIVIPRLHSSSSSSTSATPSQVVTYKGVEGVPFGPKSAPVTITLFEDFQCPYCHDLETATGKEFTALANQGKIRIIYSMVSFLDVNSKDQYSSRAANAFYCAPLAQSHALHTVFYDKWPAENTAGPTDAQLITEAKTAGITSSSYASCVTSHRYSSYATGHQTSVLGTTAGTVGTPTMQVNGKLYLAVQQLTPAILDQIVAQASSS